MIRKKIYTILLFASPLFSVVLSPQQKNILQIAGKLLEEGNINYTWGGNSEQDLDCSHFIHTVYQKAGLSFPYLTSRDMEHLSSRQLYKKFALIDLGTATDQVVPGDFLVYSGHVVLVENVNKNNLGDIIHATSGKEIRGPGQGIQRARQVAFSNFRGSLLKILRHKDLLPVRQLKPVKK